MFPFTTADSPPPPLEIEFTEENTPLDFVLYSIFFAAVAAFLCVIFDSGGAAAVRLTRLIIRIYSAIMAAAYTIVKVVCVLVAVYILAAALLPIEVLGTANNLIFHHAPKASNTISSLVSDTVNSNAAKHISGQIAKIVNQQ